MRKFRLGFICCVLFCLSSCKKKVDDVERVSMPVRIVTENLLTTMPGTLLVYDKELVWVDAVGNGSIHVIDKENGEEIQTLLLKGEGPDEVVTPDISWAPNHAFSVFDRNGAKQLLVHLSQMDEARLYERETIKYDERFRGLRMFSLKDNAKVFVTPDSLYPFLLVSDSVVSPFGEYPLKNVKDITNRLDVFQGAVAYNPYTATLLHSIGHLSYMALYKWTDRGFILNKEKVLSEIEYTLSGGNLRIDNTPEYAPTAIAITKNYIVSIERDPLAAPPATNQKKAVSTGRPFSKAPHSIFVYDYTMKLIRIVDVGIPIFRIAAAGDSDEVYLMGVNPEFCIAAVALP